MPYIQVSHQNSVPVELHYHDHGKGQPVVLIHGWPLSERSWEMQEPVLLAQGFRVIKYDRRGFGESSKPIDGYDYDTLTEDLHEIITQLDLKNAVLVGFSMGAGEVARYVGTYGTSRIAKCIFIGGITPFLLKTPDNKDGVERTHFDETKEGIRKDRLAFLHSFLKNFYSHNILGLKDVSQGIIDFSWNLASMASPIATLKCVDAWLEDFRMDLAKVDVPTLVIHGEGDKVVPFKASGARMPQFIKNCQIVEISGGPHGLLMSHSKEVNEALLGFLGQPQLEKNLAANNDLSTHPH